MRIDHYGYLGEVREAKDKSRRNLELLEQQVAEGVDTPFLHFNLGSEYSALDENERALACFEQAWSGVIDDPLQDQLRLPAVAVRAPGQGAAAVRAPRRVHRPRRRGARLPAALHRHRLRAGAGRPRAWATRSARRSLLERCLEWGDAPAAYTATGGAGTFLALATLGDLRRRQGRLDEARELLERCLVEHPRFLASVDPLAATMLALGSDPAARWSTRCTRAARRRHPGRRLHARARPVRGQGRRRRPRPSCAACSSASPARRPPAWRWPRRCCRRGATRRPPTRRCASPPAPHFAAQAARTAAFARLAAGDADGAREAIERARAAELHAPEVALLDGWQRRAAGEPGPALLPAETRRRRCS